MYIHKIMLFTTVPKILLFLALLIAVLIAFIVFKTQIMKKETFSDGDGNGIGNGNGIGDGNGNGIGIGNGNGNESNSNSNNEGIFGNWSDLMLPDSQTSNGTVKITPTVPLVLPSPSLIQKCLRKTGEIDCTSDLECTYPLKCCGNKCRPPLMVDMIRGDSLYIPQRIKICPPKKFNHSCGTDSDCDSPQLSCQGTYNRGNVCKAKPIIWDGPFFDLQAPGMTVGCGCGPYY